MLITITTWNVQNLAQSNAVFADKLNFLVGTLEALGSDVVALQEILDPKGAVTPLTFPVLLNFLSPKYTLLSNHLLLLLFTVSFLEIKRVDFYTIIRYSRISLFQVNDGHKELQKQRD